MLNLGLCKFVHLNRHVPIVFLVKQPIRTIAFNHPSVRGTITHPNAVICCLTENTIGTWRLRCTNLHKPRFNIDNEFYWISNEFPNHLLHLLWLFPVDTGRSFFGFVIKSNRYEQLSFLISPNKFALWSTWYISWQLRGRHLYLQHVVTERQTQTCLYVSNTWKHQ